MGIISELLLWGTVLMLAAGIFQWIHLHNKALHRQKQVITLYFRDVSQLKKGSPINFMGDDVGYVTRVKPLSQKVAVTMELDSDNIRIPAGSQFTVQFNGLAGAKTMEITPPELFNSAVSFIPTSKQGNYYAVEPIRLRDFLNTQQVLAQELENNSANLSAALGQIQNQAALLTQLNVIDQTTTDTIQAVDRLGTQFMNTDQTLPGRLRSNSMLLARFNPQIQQWEIYRHPARERSAIAQNLTQVNGVYYRLNALQTQLNSGQLSAQIRAFNAQLPAFQQHLETFMPRLVTGLNQFNQSMAQWNKALANVTVPPDLSLKLQNARSAADGLAASMRQLNTPKQKTKSHS